MGLRETLEKQKVWTVPLVVLAVVCAVVYAVWNTRTPNRLGGEITHAYFTEDDGKTYFTEGLERPSPFDHGGKQAYRAYVFRCGEKGKPFVQFVGRYARAGDPVVIRKRGETNWVPMGGSEGTAIIRMPCPDGDQSEAVLPDSAEP